MIFKGFLKIQPHYTSIIPLNSISPCNNDRVHTNSSVFSHITGSQDSIVSLVIRIWTGEPRKHSLTLGRGQDYSSPQHWERFWEIPNPLLSGCWGFFLYGKKS